MARAFKKVLVTGGAGFIGSAVVRYLVTHLNRSVVNVDKLTYAGNLSSLASVEKEPNYAFEQLDVKDRLGIISVLDRHQPDAIMHLAAESHVDRSIDGPGDFIQTNIVGTYNMLESARIYWSKLPISKKIIFASITYQQMKSLDPSAKRALLRKVRPMTLDRPTLQVKRRQII